MATKKGRKKATARPRTRIAAVMKEQGRTYVWLAKETGYSRTHVNAMANKRAPMNPKFVKLAASALGVAESVVA